MILNEKTKKTLWSVFAVIFIIVFAAWILLNPRPEHIEDTNGADNYSLQTINSGDIVKMEIGSRGVVSQKESKYNFAGFDVSNGVKYSSKKFTGVELLHSETVSKGSDIYVQLSSFNIKEGNFAFYIVYDGEIVGQLTPTDDGITEFVFNNIKKTGTVEYIIAGESARFSFVMPTGFN